ncbi:hypothetical protein GWN49_01855 [Candidatus Bathyarchaeota archaeon]|nr:hypothetical protein [Candidatus Bathyarchaeota archaeon]
MSEKKVIMAEFRKTIATSLGTAFGIVIGMIWTNVVLGAFATAGIPLTTAGGTWFQWFYLVIVAIIVTIICVIAIIFNGKWGGKE